MGKIIQRLLVVLLILTLFGVSIFPPEKQLRRGKDLAGGVSLTYAVQIAEGEDPKTVLAKTIDVLKNRVDPDGVMDISMVAQGRDRIEITMPLPSDRVKGLRKQFEDALAELGRNRLTPARLQQAMQAPADQRPALIDQLAAGNAQRKELLQAAASAFDQAAAAGAAYQAGRGGPDEVTLANAAAAADIAYEQARDAVLRTALDAGEIRKVVQSSTRVRMVDDQGGARVPLPTPREVAEAQLRERHPDSIETIDRLLGLHAQYAAQRTTLDDPNDLIRLLRGAGVLSFRITVRPGQLPEEQRLREELRRVGPRNVKATDVRWFRINQIENWINNKAQAEALKTNPEAIAGILGGYVAESYGGEFYMLAYDTPTTRLTPAEGQWAVAGAMQGVDQRGRPAINFRMDPAGAQLLSRLTGQHVNEGMAILLDDQVYTAPTLNSEIGASGQITGEFPPEELNYVIRVLNGGSLQAKLSPEPISNNTIGPELGADNLRMGLETGVICMVITMAFMVFYYFTFGGVAVLAIIANAVCILGAMALARASFTMPGIAGVILTFGMAVDSNVLIFERMREEFNRGADMRTAVRMGFSKALSAIVDGNITNLIVCVALYATGTPEIRGFAVTMGVGVVSTLFTALVVSRVIFELMIALGWRKGSMLPMAVPKLQAWLTPSIDWMRLRYVFFAISVVYVSLGLGMVIFQGGKMLDNEFRGGTAVTLAFKPTADPDDDPAARMTMTRAQVEDRVHDLGRAAPDGDVLKDLVSAEVFPINPTGDGTISDRFTVKTLAQNTNNVVLDAITKAFGDELEVSQALAFKGSESGPDASPAFAIDKPSLGQNINMPAMRTDATPYMGGVAIVLEGIQPPQPLASLRSRLDAMRQTEQFSDTLSRSRDVLVLAGTEQAVVSAVIVVADETASIFENESRWQVEVKEREWALVREALTKESSPASVFTFSPAIAETFRANAIAATLLSFIGVGIYIWVRFKAPRYSYAAIVALVHDVLVVVGLVALAEILYEADATHGFAASIKLLPFKIDLNMVAALLTIAGYSLNDTVVIMDRIRENKGKLPHATREIINRSINQTFSRTLITGGTTMASCVILYLYGGEGMRAFSFALLTGLIVGTYSSVAIAAPIVWSRRAEDQMRDQISKA